MGWSPMAALSLGPRAAALAEGAARQAPGNPRFLFWQAMNTYFTPSFLGGGPQRALPSLEKAARKAEAETFPPGLDPWSPRWGRVEILGWLAMAQARLGRGEEARATAGRVLALDPGDRFVLGTVLPALDRTR